MHTFSCDARMLQKGIKPTDHIQAEGTLTYSCVNICQYSTKKYATFKVLANYYCSCQHNLYSLVFSIPHHWQ